MLVILGAMREEIADLRKQMTIEEAYAEKNYSIYCGKYRNKDVLLGQTGIGKRRAERTTEYVLDRFHATALINIGFAGALVKGLKIGDVVPVTTLYCHDSRTSDVPELQSPLYSDKDLISLANRTYKTKAPGLPHASSVTVANPVCEPATKLALGEASTAEVVDMESYWIARIASARGIPFLNIRVISDTVEDELPPFEKFMNTGNRQWLRTALYFLVHPKQLLRLFYFYRNARRARKSLTVFMDHFINNYEIAEKSI